MFNFGEILEKAQDIIGSSGAGEGGIGEALSNLVSNSQLDPAVLENLSVDEFGNALENIGIDAAALSETQIGEIAQQFAEHGSLEQLDLNSLLGMEATK